MWTETETGHWRFETKLGVSVVISPKFNDKDIWRYRVADFKYTAMPDTSLEQVKTFAVAMLKSQLAGLLAIL